jgi:hypothetical protein|tara:strand:+ start:201 stop:338 length:138 start_codon:yes stop_codon:yes gene_type:complete
VNTGSAPATALPVIAAVDGFAISAGLSLAKEAAFFDWDAQDQGTG